MQHDQGFTGSHWMPPSGNYLLCIAQAAAREGDNQLNDDATWTHFVGRFDGHRDVAVLHTAHIAQWRRFMAFIKATECHHRMSTCSDITQLDMPTPVVLDISS